MTLDISPTGISLSRQIEIQTSLKFEHPVRQAVVAGAEVVVESSQGSTRIVTVHSLSEGKHAKPKRTFTIPASSYKLLYIKSRRVFVASCEDLRLRVFSSSFDVLQAIPTQGSLLCLLYCHEKDEVLAGGVGHLHSWVFRQNQILLSKSSPFTTTIKSLQWVVNLSLSQDSRTLLAVTHKGVHVINLQIRQEMSYIPNGHKSGISCVLSYMDVLITAGKDGSLIVWSSRILQPLHSINAHSREIITMATHPTKPHLYTSSSDGCIKVWDMNTLTEMYQFYTSESNLMDFNLFVGNQALCYSSKTVMILNISMPDSHFSSLSSKVTKLSLSTQPGRLIALCEDGGIRLVSPASGVVTNVVFPEFTNVDHSFEEVVYSREHASLLVLLKTHEVMIFDATVNPCSCQALCTPDSPEDGVSCLTQGCVFYDGVEVELIFAGHLSGFISLLSSSSVTMKASIGGHKGAIRSLSLSPSHPQLLSFSSDGCLKVWSLPLHYGDLRMSALLTITLGEEGPISHAVLSHHTVCLGYNMGTVKTISVSDHVDDGNKADILQLMDLKTFTHSPSERHVGTLLSLSTSQHLPLFCTLAEDNYVKLWNTECLLLRELHLGVGLSGACVVGNPCLLVVASRNNLWITEEVIAEGDGNLVGKRSSICSSKHLTPKREQTSVSFDPSVQFWYDPSRSKRQSVDPHSPSGGLLIPPQSTPASHDGGREMLGSHAEHKMTSTRSQDVVETHASLNDLKAKIAISTGGVSNRRGKEDMLNAGARPGDDGLRLNTSKPIRLMSLSQVSSMSQGVGDNIECSADAVERHRSADVSRFCANLNEFGMHPPFHIPRSVLLGNPYYPSAQYPIAPDGFIPNSVIRGKFTLRKIPEGDISTQQSVDDLSFNLSSILAGKRRQRSTIPEENSTSSLSFGLSCRSSFDSTGRVSTEGETSLGTMTIGSFLKDFKVGVPKKPQTAKKSAPISKGLTLPSRPRPKIDLEEIDLDLSMGYTGRRRVPKNLKKKPHPQPRPSGAGSDSCDSDFPMSRSPTPYSIPNPRSSLLSSASFGETSQSTTASQHHTIPEAARRTSSQYSHTRRLSASLRKSSGGGFPLVPRGLRAKSGSTLGLLERITSQEWYPRSSGTRPLSAKTVVDNLIKLIETAKSSHVLQKVCTSLEEIHNANLCPKEAYSTIEEIITQQLQKRSNSSKVTLLEMITRIGLRSRRLLQSLIPLLGSRDTGVREATFAALDELAGVTNKKELGELMVELGLITKTKIVNNDVEVLEELAQRLQNDQKSQGINSLKIRFTGEVSNQSLGDTTDILSLSIEDQSVEVAHSEGNYPTSEQGGRAESKDGDPNSSFQNVNSLEMDDRSSEEHHESISALSYRTLADSAEALLEASKKRRNGRTKMHPALKLAQCNVSSYKVNSKQEPTSDQNNPGTKELLKCVPVPLRHLLLKNPSQLPAEIISFLYGRKDVSPQKLGHKYRWCEVYPVVQGSVNHPLPRTK